MDRGGRRLAARGPVTNGFLHTPDNNDAPALARRFYDDVRALVPGLDALPEPEPIEPATLF